MGMSVLTFPMSPLQVLELIQHAAQAGRIIYPTFEQAAGWYAMVTRRQIQKCLREGQLVGNPATDPNGHIDFSMSAWCAGLDVRVTGQLQDQGGWYIIVITVENVL